MYDIVRYHNEFNNAYPLMPLSKNENKFLSLLLLSLYNREDQLLEFTFEEIALKLGLIKKNPAYVYDFLKSADDKFRSYRFHSETNSSSSIRPLYIRVELFPTFIINPETQKLSVRINHDYKWLVNNLLKEYTAYAYSEYEKLDNIYAQILFRNIKKWKVRGCLEFNDIELFRKIFGVSDKYRNSDIVTRIIVPAVEAINSINGSITELKYEVLYKGKNHQLCGLVFTWKPEKKCLAEGLREKSLSPIIYSLENQNITQEQFDMLCAQFDEVKVKNVIERIITKHYTGCLNVKTIEQWCEEHEYKQENQAVRENINRSDIDYKALESKLFNR